MRMPAPTATNRVRKGATTEMKRYLLFAYHPHEIFNFGWDGFREAYDTMEEAQAESKTLTYPDCNYQIVDTTIMEIIEEGEVK